MLTEHCAIDLLRRWKGDRTLPLESAAELRAPAAEPEDRILLMNALNKLPNEQRSAVLLALSCGLTAKEVARTLDCSVSKAEKLINRGCHGQDRPRVGLDVKRPEDKRGKGVRPRWHDACGTRNAPSWRGELSERAVSRISRFRVYPHEFQPARVPRTLDPHRRLVKRPVRPQDDW